MEEYYNEVDKCELLCCNCHIEKHDDHRGVYEKLTKYYQNKYLKEWLK